IQVRAIGGAGGEGGGFGALVSGRVPVTPGAIVYVEVAGDGVSSGVRGFGGAGGYGGGAAGGARNGGIGAGGGGGGGATDLQTCSQSVSQCPGGITQHNSLLLVAAGGGG